MERIPLHSYQNGTFYLKSCDRKQPIKRPQFNEVLHNILYIMFYMGGRHHQNYDTCVMNGHKHVRFIVNTSDSLSLEMKQRSLVI